MLLPLFWELPCTYCWFAYSTALSFCLTSDGAEAQVIAVSVLLDADHMLSTVRKLRGGGQPCLRDCLVDNSDGHPLDCSSQTDGAAVQIRQLLEILYTRHPLFKFFLPCHHQAPGGRPWDDGSGAAPVSAYLSIQSTSRKSSAAKLDAMSM